MVQSLIAGRSYPRILGRLLRFGLPTAMMIGWIFAVPPNGHSAERPPLKGGIDHSEPYRPPSGRPAPKEAICERYSADVSHLSGRIQVMPKAAGGPGPMPQGRPVKDYCLAPDARWTLLGEDGNYCCFFAPNDWVPKIPPLPGEVEKDRPIPNRRPSPTPWDGPLPGEQPAHAQSSRFLGNVAVTVNWDSNVQENGRRIHRKGECKFQFEFYTDGKALARNFTYYNEDRTQPFPDRIDVEAIQGSASNAVFTSNVSLVPKPGGRYDISWTNPSLTASQRNWSEYPQDRGVRRGPQGSGAPGQLYEAYCIGRSVGMVGNRPAVQVRLVDVPLQASYPAQRANTIMLRDLQKQVPAATVTMAWSFQPPNSR